MGVCGLIRFYCYRNGVTWLEDCKPEEVKSVRRRLWADAVTVTHVELL